MEFGGSDRKITKTGRGGEVVPVEGDFWSGGHSSSTASLHIYTGRAYVAASVHTAVATAAAAVVVEKVGGRSIWKKGYSTWGHRSQ